MGFSTDYEDNKIIAMGEYEVIIKDFKERTTKTGKTGMNFKLAVRDDVEQPYKKAVIFHTLWKRKEPTQKDMQIGGYGFNQFMYLAKCANIPSGKSYETIYDLCKDLVGKCIRVNIIHDTYNGYTNAVVDGISNAKVLYNPVQPVAPPPQQSVENVQIGDLNDFEVISVGDVPF